MVKASSDNWQKSTLLIDTSVKYCNNLLTTFLHLIKILNNLLYLVCRYSIIKSCCHWNPQQRLSMSELIRKLQAGEKSANGRTVLRVPEPLDIGKYMREAGYGEAYNYAVLWLAERGFSLEYVMLFSPPIGQWIFLWDWEWRIYEEGLLL